MLTELTQFVRNVPSFIKEKAIEPKTGLHIRVAFNNGQYQMIGHERYLGKKHGAISNFLNQCAILQHYSWMIDSNKCLSKSKDIHSANPYCFAIKRESWYGGDFFEINKQKKKKPSINERLDDYFSQCLSERFSPSEGAKASTPHFNNFIKSKLLSLLSELPEYGELEKDDYLIVYIETELEEYKSFNIKYLADGLFNTSEYNIEINDDTFGTSNFYNGFNSKKPFLTHQTASFDITGRISATQAKELSEFALLIGKKLFPNPLPIFIDDSELTNEAIEIFQRGESKKTTHRKIINELLKKKETLGNYYLLYFSNGAIQDFDFVARFEYHLNTDQSAWMIKNVTDIIDKDKQIQSDISLSDVFDFEMTVVQELFNNTLVKVDEKKGEASFRYFDDMDPKYYRPALYTLLLKYRKPVYDFIYKSMRNGIRENQFQDICMTMIMDELKQGREFSIKRKLNIYFSLYPNFDSNNQSIMPSNIEEHKIQLRLVVDNDDTHFNSDEVYAFGAGQLIYYLLSQSEAGDRTHALLEPFLQKTNSSHFNEAISSTILKYKHALSFNYKRFNTLAAEVLDYKTEKELQELRPIILAGYFCPNIFYTSTKK